MQRQDADSGSDTPQNKAFAEWIGGVAYIGVHNLSGEFLDESDALGGSLLELDALESLVEVESVVSARGLHLLLSFVVLAHVESYLF